MDELGFSWLLLHLLRIKKTVGKISLITQDCNNLGISSNVDETIILHRSRCGVVFTPRSSRNKAGF
jgi:hypothetical protein